MLTFNEDESVLYIGTLSNNGQVFALDFNKDHDPDGEPYLFASNVGGGYHDGIGMDVCGNLYVADYNTRGLYRISPTGSVTALLTGLGGNYGHALEWGSGIGGWQEMSIYMPQPYNNNNVMEVAIGVPAKGWEGTVINK